MRLSDLQRIQNNPLNDLQQNAEKPDGANWIQRGSSIRIAETPVGKGVFTDRPFPINSIVGDITGRLIRDRPYGSSYSIEVDANTQLEPHAPFRFLNHSCNPNCEIDWHDEAVYCDNPVMYVIALRDIEAGEELTIDYNWPAEAAIRCGCGELDCRGWVVSVDVLDQLSAEQQAITYGSNAHESDDERDATDEL